MEPFVVRPEAGAGYEPLLKGGEQTVRMHSGCVGLEAGAEVGEHSTKGHEEVLVILEGAGTLRIEGHHDLEVAAGSLAYVPPHTTHNVVNTGTGLLRYVYIVAPVPG